MAARAPPLATFGGRGDAPGLPGVRRRANRYRGHIAGFAVGTTSGVGLADADDHVPQGASAQWIFGIAALALFALAWLLALRAHG
jgi:hypothetical protein